MPREVFFYSGETEMLPSDWLEQIKSVYPRRSGGQGWGYVKRRIPDLVEQGHTFAELFEGAKEYGEYCRATNNKYVRMARTFFGPDEWWLEDYDIPRDGSAELTLDQEAEEYDLVRQEGESDESLKQRLGIAVTKRMYG